MNTFPWFKNYESNIRHTLEPYPQTTLADIVHQTAVETPQRSALWFKGKTIS